MRFESAIKTTFDLFATKFCYFVINIIALSSYIKFIDNYWSLWIHKSNNAELFYPVPESEFYIRRVTSQAD